MGRFLECTQLWLLVVCLTLLHLSQIFLLIIRGDIRLTPYGHSASTSERPSDYADLVGKAQVGANAIKAYNGTNFVIGTSAELLCKFIFEVDVKKK